MKKICCLRVIISLQAWRRCSIYRSSFAIRQTKIIIKKTLFVTSCIHEIPRIAASCMKTKQSPVFSTTIAGSLSLPFHESWFFSLFIIHKYFVCNLISNYFSLARALTYTFTNFTTTERCQLEKHRRRSSADATTAVFIYNRHENSNRNGRNNSRSCNDNSNSNNRNTTQRYMYVPKQWNEKTGISIFLS